MEHEELLRKISTFYDFGGSIISFEPYGNGHINDTYMLVCTDHTSKKCYIIQRINNFVFNHPADVMENITRVTTFLQDKLRKMGQNPKQHTLTLISAKDGQMYVKIKKDFFRIYEFIANSFSIERIESPFHAYQCGKAFGEFQVLLADYPIRELKETIVNFHNTKSRFFDFVKSLQADPCKRAKDVEREIDFALSHRDDAFRVVDLLAKSELPLRVTHNDTKINNLLFNRDHADITCVIDLDTVMPGSLLYDFGDAIRTAANTANEDETDLSKVQCSEEYFEQFTKGFLEKLSPVMTDQEFNLLAFSARLMALECGIRFLKDYIDGDVYFKTHRPHHNLDRCRTQFALVEDMERKSENLEKIILKYKNRGV